MCIHGVIRGKYCSSCVSKRLAERKEKGLCKSCPQQAVRGKTQCAKHAKKGREDIRRHYQRNPKKRAAVSARWRKEHPERWKEIADKSRRTESSRFSRAKSSAKRLKRLWFLSKEEYRSLIENNCTYCNGPLPGTGSGLDRIDNKRGYEVGNVLPCCTDCNQLRGDRLSVEETCLLVRYLLSIRKFGIVNS